MNVVSKDLVDKLGLQQELHPTPYRVGWINDVSSVLVKNHCLIKFSLGKHYSDEVWCDVLPMTACHLLLGRPWLYDRKVSYDGFHNTYSFIFQNRRLILEPLPIVEFESPKESSTLLTLREFTKAAKTEPLIFLVLGRVFAKLFLLDFKTHRKCTVR